MAIIELEASEIDVVNGAALGDTTTISGSGGTVMYYDNGDGTSWMGFASTDGSVKYYKLVRTPTISRA